MWKNNLIFAFCTELPIYIFLYMPVYDVVIIGSGLGGLLSAVILAKEGLHVAIVEQNKQVGGCLQTFSFDKKIFDSCVHYIGSMEDGQTQKRIFDYVGISDYLKIKKLDENCFDQIHFSEENPTFPLAQGLDNFATRLKPYFPADHEAIDSYTNLLKYTANCFPLFNLRNGLSSEKQLVSEWSLNEIMNRVQNPKLRNVLMGNNLLYAGCPDSTPFYVHALVSKSYIDSAFKCVGGSSQIARLLWRKLQEYGGAIFRKEKVCRLEEEGGLLTHAVTTSGKVFEGKRFIANIHPSNIMQMIDSKLFKSGYRNRIVNATNSIAAFMVNIVLKPGKVPYQNANYYWHRSEDSYHALKYLPGEWPANYALYFTEDPMRPGYSETVAILCYMRTSEWAPWYHTFNATVSPSARETTYREFKEQKAEQVLATVARQHSWVKEELYSMQIATPLTFRDYMGSPDGSMYGIMADARHPEMTSIPIKTKIANLFMTGQNIGLHGVLGVSINAVATCGEILGLDYILQKINN